MADEPQEGRIILYQEDGRNVPVEVTYWRGGVLLPTHKKEGIFLFYLTAAKQHMGKKIFNPRKHE